VTASKQFRYLPRNTRTAAGHKTISSSSNHQRTQKNDWRQNAENRSWKHSCCGNMRPRKSNVNTKKTNDLQDNIAHKANHGLNGAQNCLSGTCQKVLFSFR